MNWTDEIGQELLAKADAAIAKVHGKEYLTGLRRGKRPASIGRGARIRTSPQLEVSNE